MQTASYLFASSETSERLETARTRGLNATSFQLSVLVANFGNLSRPLKVKNKRLDIEGPSVLARLLVENYSHVRCLMESETLQSDKYENNKSTNMKNKRTTVSKFAKR